MDISGLETSFLEFCKRHQVKPNSAILAWFSEAKIHKSLHEKCSMTVFLDHLTVDDVWPLLYVFGAINSSDIDAVDIVHESPCVLNEDHIMSLLRAIGVKLQLVDLQDTSIGKDFLRDLCEDGLPCQVLNLRSTHIRKLNMIGNFMQLHTLNLDFCTSLTSLQQDCFSCMPNLRRLSMCETRVANLWTTSAVLSKLPSLLELRFQNCLCCKDTGPCPASSAEKAPIDITFEASGTTKSVKEVYYLDSYMTDDSSEDGETQLSGQLQDIGLSPNIQVKLQNEIRDNDGSRVSVLKRNLTDASIPSQQYISHHPSPICFEKHYREYMVVSLPRLEVLDNLRIIDMERQMAKAIFSRYYEHMPYKRQGDESIVSVLQMREMGAKQPHGKSQCFFSRSLAAAKLGASTGPLTQPISSFSQVLKEGSKRLRPRQFEYHPSEPSLMALGTLDGEVVVINHESGSVVGHVPSIGAANSILGLCWLKNHPSKLIAGSDDGGLTLFDINNMTPRVSEVSCRSNAVKFDHFEQLTSVHVNSSDDQFLVSGYSKNIALYDISSGKRLHLFTNLHREPINVAKFSHHCPFTFVTSSFDHDVKMWDLRVQPLRPCYTSSSSRGNVMVCFSPNDQYLLVSAVDNEVKQLGAVDGRLHMEFDIASTGSAHNYTRSYYMNGGDYIISGSCDETLVRICCAQTGRRLRDVHLEDRDTGTSMFVQSLRGDPYRPFHMSILAASKRPNSKWEIIKGNLLASNGPIEESSYGHHIRPSYSLGG